MSLTVTAPTDYAPAYNPVILSITSNVRDDFTVLAAKTISSVSNNNGFVQLNFSAAHSVGVNSFLLVTSAPGQDSYLGVGRITQIVDADSLVIDKPFIGTLTASGTAFKYIKDYNITLYFYIYVSSAPSTALLASTLTLKPKFEGGFCKWDIDLAPLVKEFNFNAFTIDDVLESDLFPLEGTAFQINKKSFVKYGFEAFESFTTQNGYGQQNPAP